jgi:hypothetical protein
VTYPNAFRQQAGAKDGAGGVEGAELVGSLRRKKNQHGFFEDPWKAKVLCWVTGGTLQLKLADTVTKTGFQARRPPAPPRRARECAPLPCAPCGATQPCNGAVV